MVRRSSRANKGKNSRLEDSDEERGVEEVRCLVCGTIDSNYDEEADDHGEMIECETCLTWQHIDCMARGKKDITKEYKCNVCTPEKYLKLELALSKEEYFLRLKKGKIHSRVAPEILRSILQNAEESEDTTQEVKESPVHDVRPPKKKKKAGKSVVREGVIKQFEKIYVDFLTKNQETDESAHLWALELEQEMYKLFNDSGNTKDPGNKYREKYRNLFVALKDSKNTKLRERIIQGELSNKDLLGLGNEQLINPELQKFREDSIKLNLANSTLKVPDAKLATVRSNFKGELIAVEEDQYDDGNMSLFGRTENQRKDDDVNEDDAGGADQKVNQSDNREVLNNGTSKLENKNSVVSNSKDKIVPSDSKPVTGGFNYNDEMNEELVDIDDDGLDGILEDEEAEAEQPDDSYDPEIPQINSNDQNSDTYDPENFEIVSKTVLWRGGITFDDVANFDCEVIYNCTSNASLKNLKNVAYTLLDLDRPLEIAGRINKDTAEKYLHQVTQARNLFILEILPKSDNVSFNRMFKYFKSKLRYGVVRNRNPFIKDLYLVPIDYKQKQDLPKYLRSVENFSYDYSGQPKIFCILTVKKDYLPGLEEIENAKYRVRDSLPPLLQPQPDVIASLTNSLDPQQFQVLQDVIAKNPDSQQNPSKLLDILRGYSNE